MKNIALYLVLALALCGFSCSLKRNDMKILTENYPPLSFEENGKVTGYGAEVVQAIQEELGTNVQPVLLKWDEAYQRALKEKNVVLFTMEKTAEREGKFNFIGPLGNNTTYFYALADKEITITDLKDAKHAIGIATTTNWFTEQMLKDQGFTNLLSNTDPLETIKCLKESKAELGVFTDLTFPQLCMEAGFAPDAFKPVFELTHTEYYIAISKSTDPETVELWENAYKKLVDSGKIDQLKEKWLP